MQIVSDFSTKQKKKLRSCFEFPLPLMNISIVLSIFIKH